MPALIPFIPVVLGAMGAQGTALFLSVAISAYTAKRARKQARAQALAQMQDRAQTFRSADAPRITVYGRQLVSGPWAFPPVTSGEHGELIHAGVILASHRINAVLGVKINDRWLGELDAQGYVKVGSPFWKSKLEIVSESPTPDAQGRVTLTRDPWGGEVFAFVPASGSADSYTPEQLIPVTVSGRVVSGFPPGWSGQVRYTAELGRPLVRVIVHHGADDQAADALLIQAMGGTWTANHRLRGIAWLHVVCEYDTEIFAQGLNNVAAEVEGKLLLDVRDGQVRYSNNAVLATRDFLASQSYGWRATNIDAAMTVAAANISDEVIPSQLALLYGRPQPRRYTINGTVSWEADRREILEDMEEAMAGRVEYIGSRWCIRAGAYEPPVMDLNDDDLADGSTQGQAFAAMADSFNSVRGTLVDGLRDYVQTDFPPYRSATYIGEDGGLESWLDMSLPYCDDTERAQRIGKLVLFRSRQATTDKAPWKLKAARLVPGNRVRLTRDRRGWVNKVFEVMQCESDLAKGRVDLVLQEDAPEVYAWDFNEAIAPDPAPNTNLPNPFQVAMLANLRASSGELYADRMGDGTLTSYVLVQWDQPADASVLQGGRIEVRYRLLDDTDWRPTIVVEGDVTSTKIAPVTPHLPMLIQARPHNGLAGGPWRTIAHVVDAGAPGTIGDVLWSQIQGPGKPEDGATRVRQYSQEDEPTDAPPNSLWYRPSTGALYRRPVSGLGWALVSTVGADGSTLKAGVGANLLGNAGMAKGIQGFVHAWNPTTAMSMMWVGEGSDPWSGQFRARPFGGIRYGGPAIFPNGTALGTWVGDALPVQPGARIEAQVQVCAHRVSMHLHVIFYDGAGGALADQAVAGGVSGIVNGYQGWDTAALLWGFVETASVPAGAVTMRPAVHHFAANPGGDGATTLDGFSFKPLIGYANPGQTQPSPWVDGAPRGALSVIDLAATMNIAEQAATIVGEQRLGGGVAIWIEAADGVAASITMHNDDMMTRQVIINAACEFEVTGSFAGPSEAALYLRDTAGEAILMRSIYANSGVVSDDIVSRSATFLIPGNSTRTYQLLFVLVTPDIAPFIEARNRMIRAELIKR